MNGLFFFLIYLHCCGDRCWFWFWFQPESLTEAHWTHQPCEWINMFLLILDSFFVSILCLQTSHSKLLLGFYHSVMDLGNFEWMLISATYVYSFITNKWRSSMQWNCSIFDQMERGNNTYFKWDERDMYLSIRRFTSLSI